MDGSLGTFAKSFRAMSSPLLSSILLPSSMSSSSPSSSSLILFIMSAAVLLGQVTSTARGYDYDVYDDAFNGPNIVKIKKVVDYYAKPQYAFGYEVDDYYNQLSHGRWEIRDGDVTQGQYRVLLPDGRIQIVSYIADKFGYRPTVEYIGKGAHPPPPPAYAHVKVPKILEVAPVEIAKPVVLPSAFPILETAVPFSKVAAPLGLEYGPAPAPLYTADPVKIKVNSLPINGPLPLVDPYALGYGYGLDPAFAGSNAVNKISRKRALLYGRETLFRKDVEGRRRRKVVRSTTPKSSELLSKN